MRNLFAAQLRCFAHGGCAVWTLGGKRDYTVCHELRRIKGPSQRRDQGNPVVTTPLPRRSRPIAFCVRCGRPHTEDTLDKTAICLRADPAGGVCGGRVTWRADPHDWVECPVCAATGQTNSVRCPRCDGAGWLLRGG